MATTVTVTGTGTPIITPDRAGPGVLVTCDDIELLVDAGRNTVGRLAAAGTAPGRLDAVALTHYHSDHLVGLQDVVLTRWILDFDDVVGPLDLVAPTGPTTEFCRRMLDVWAADLDVRAAHNGRAPVPGVNVVGFDCPEVPTLVWERDQVRVWAGPVRHEPVVGAVGYRVETPDGVVAISGDTAVCDEFAALAAGADVVVHEAMRMDVIAQRPPDRRYIMDYHADTRLLGAQMAELDVATLLLTHLIPPPTTPDEARAFAEEVREGGYRGEVVVCDDLDSVVLTAGRVSAPGTGRPG